MHFTGIEIDKSLLGVLDSLRPGRCDPMRRLGRRAIDLNELMGDTLPEEKGPWTE